MRTVGLKTLKNKLGEYVRLAASGETVIITDRGIREGWIRPAVRGPDWPPKPTPIEGYTLERLLADRDEDREDQ